MTWQRFCDVAASLATLSPHVSFSLSSLLLLRRRAARPPPGGRPCARTRAPWPSSPRPPSRPWPPARGLPATASLRVSDPSLPATGLRYAPSEVDIFLCNKFGLQYNNDQHLLHDMLSSTPSACQRVTCHACCRVAFHQACSWAQTQSCYLAISRASTRDRVWGSWGHTYSESAIMKHLCPLISRSAFGLSPKQ